MSIDCTDTLAPLPVITRGNSYVLGGDPKGKNLVYTNGKNVIMRNLENPKICDIFSEHKQKVSVAKYSPSGFYICSADEHGNIMIWDTVNPEHIVKYKYQPIAGNILDIAWGPESKRIAICGQGRQTHASVIFADSGSTVGNLDKLVKKGNSITYKPTRPYRIATGDDSHEVIVFEGPPFKQGKTHRGHGAFVNSVRYSPDGNYLATASSDKRVFLYDGKTSELLGQLGCEKKGAHSGGIYSISWSPDSKELMTVSGDKSVKIWNIDTKEEVVNFVMGKVMEDQQYASLWMGDYILSVSLSGVINYLDRNDPSKPSRVLHGHSRPLSKIIAIPSESFTHVSGDMSGKLFKYDTCSGEAFPFSGAGHANKIAGLAYDKDSNRLISVGWDDKMYSTCLSSLDFSTSDVVPLGSQPLGVALAPNGYIVINTLTGILLYKGINKKVFTLPHEEDFSPTGFAVHGTTVVVQAKKYMFKIYNIEGDCLVDSGNDIEAGDVPFYLSFSPDGSKLAVGQSDKIIRVYEVADNYKTFKELIGHHSPRLHCFSWSPDSQQAASGSMDASLRLWNLATDKKMDVQNAHKQAQIVDIAWLDNNTVLSAGNGCLTKQWTITW